MSIIDDRMCVHGPVGSPGVTERDDDTDLRSFAEDVQRLGERIRDIRIERRMTQEDVADRADINRTHVSDIERGRKPPTVTTLYRLAHALRVHPADILDDRNEDTLIQRLRHERKTPSD